KKVKQIMKEITTNYEGNYNKQIPYKHYHLKLY
ncbi:hypothetical protein U024_02781, partial [Staphylococcus aureus WMCA6126]